MKNPFKKLNALYEKEPYKIKEKKVSEVIEDLEENEKEEFYDNLEELAERIEKPTKEVENHSFWGEIEDRITGGWKNYVWAALAIGGGATAVVNLIENPGEVGKILFVPAGYGAMASGFLSLSGIIRDKSPAGSNLSRELRRLPYSDFRNISEEYGFL